VITSTAPSKIFAQYDFISRVFYQGDEDAVTGSAHCGLATFWSNRHQGQREFKAFQASKRGGEIDIKLVGNERVLLSGHAILVAEGTFNI
jgi:predicted PhzF superfamily epimerase YddE/YHI9